MAAAMATVIQGHGVARALRPWGVSTIHRKTPGARNRAEYFEMQARPAVAPASSHQRGEPSVQTLPKVHRVRTQNRVAGASGVARMPPTPTVVVALYQTAALRPVSGRPPR